jgi:hypothetical protein
MAAKKFKITLADGKEIEVTPNIEDTLAFETALRKNKGWGQLQDATLKLVLFRAWNAARRAELIDLSWEQFSSGPSAALDVAGVVDDKPDLDPAEQLVSGLGKDTPTEAPTASSSPSRSARAFPRVSGEVSTPTT